MEREKEISKLRKHTVFVSSDEEDEISVKKLRYDSTKNYDKKSSHAVDQKRESTSEEVSRMESVKKSKSDSKKKRKHISSHFVDQNRELSDDGESCQIISGSEPKRESKKKKKSSHAVEQKRESPGEEVFRMESVTKSKSDSKKKRKHKSSHTVDRTREVSSDEESCQIISGFEPNPDSKKKKSAESVSHVVDQKSIEEVSPMKPNKKLKSDSRCKTKSEIISSHVIDQKQESSSDEESCQIESVKESKSDSEKKVGKKSLHAVDQKRKSSSEDVSQMKSVKKSKSDSRKDTENNSSQAVDHKEHVSIGEESSTAKPSKRIRRAPRKNQTELKCPVCVDFRTLSVLTFSTHLRRIHSTNFGLAGIFLRCDCGHEAQSEEHLRACEIANYTLIRRRDGPLRTYHDKKITPKCIFCEVYPKTICGYAAHLEAHHKSSLAKNSKFLLCSCGHRVTSSGTDPTHKKKCDGRKFSMHDLDEKGAVPVTQ